MGTLSDVQQLEPGNEVFLYELDATGIGGDLLRFHGHMQQGSIIWQGNEYKPWPMQSSGFQRTGDAQQASPTLTVGNVDGHIGTMCLVLGDLVGAAVRRHRVLARYLDAINFPNGNPSANADEAMSVDLFYVEQKSGDVFPQIEFTLASALDLNGQRLPSTQIIANVCPWLAIGGYRGPYCGYAGAAMFDLNDNPTNDPALDKCAGRLKSCKCRFGANSPLPIGSFPAADLTGSN